jgi:hypothetical protein
MRINGNLRILVSLLVVSFAAMLIAASSASAAQRDIKAPKAKFAQNKSGQYVRTGPPPAATQAPLQNQAASNPAGPTSYCCTYLAPGWGTAATYGNASYCFTYYPAPAPVARPLAASSWSVPATSGGTPRPVAAPPPRAQPAYTCATIPYCSPVEFYGWPSWAWEYWY